MTALPDPWTALVLGLAAYRLTRLGGWDDWPPIAKLRAWLLGERWIYAGQTISELIAHGERIPLEPSVEGDVVKVPGPGNFWIDGGEVELPGKTPDSEADGVRPAYARPLLAHLVHCPFCLGWWISLASYLWWLLTPAWGLYALAPFALSGFVGLVAKNLDP